MFSGNLRTHRQSVEIDALSVISLDFTVYSSNVDDVLNEASNCWAAVPIAMLIG